MNILAVTSRALLGTPVSRAMMFPIRLRANSGGRLLAKRGSRLRANGSGRVFGFMVAALLTTMARLWHHAGKDKASEAKIAVITQQLAHSDES